MADATADAAPKKSGKGLLFGAVAALLLGGGGFYAVWSGLILAPAPAESIEAEAAPEGEAEPFETAANHAEGIAFLPVEPIVISLTGAERDRHLRFRAELEVPEAHGAEVQHLMPRIVDVMNGYLRAVDPAKLDTPGALMDVRAQLLRRVGLVVGMEKVRDVLVMEFVLS